MTKPDSGVEGPTIRRAEQRDAPALARLIDQLGYAATPQEVARRLAEMEAEGRVVLVAEGQAGVIGPRRSGASR